MLFCTGCPIPQPRGEGLYRHVQEPTTGAWYHLYLPVDYVRNNGRHPDPEVKRWPLVMTFHGMKPYDNALPQEREWEQQADIYGYVVCAPELSTSDSFMEYPLTQEHSYVLTDRRNVLAIMDHVFTTTRADRNRVLATSWSCGGYLAHYFVNRFPERFHCIATRLSNFSPALMLEDTVARYRHRVPVAIFIGDGDFPACKTESEEAVAWYIARGFKTVRGKMIDNMGHSRIPQTAAAFFAEQIGIEPLRPVLAAETVAQVQMTEYHPPQELIARVAPPIGPDLLARRSPRRLPDSPNARPSRRQSTRATTPPVVPPTTPPDAVASAQTLGAAGQTTLYSPVTAGRRYPFDKTPTFDPTPPKPEPSPSQVAAAPPTGPQRPTSASEAARTTNAPPERIAQADRQRGNWLEKTRSASDRRRSDRADGAPASGGATRAPSKQPAEKKGTTRSTPPPSVAKASPTRSGRRSDPSSRTTTSHRRFSPRDAGSRDYRPAESSNASTTLATVPARSAAGGARRRSPDAHAPVPPRSARQPEPFRRVNIRLSGPAIGTSPHYLAYAVDLPRPVIDGADFLWMDNGVWIGDESRGVKILESPGLHRITVLVVTRDNVEYRGSATVQVLDRGPTAAAY